MSKHIKIPNPLYCVTTPVVTEDIRALLGNVSLLNEIDSMLNPIWVTFGIGRISHRKRIKDSTCKTVKNSLYCEWKEDIVNKVEYLEMVKVVANCITQKYIEHCKAKGLQVSTFTLSVDDPYFSDETNSGFISVSLADSTPMFALKSEESCAQICDVYETRNNNSQDMASEFSDDSVQM